MKTYPIQLKSTLSTYWGKKGAKNLIQMFRATGNDYFKKNPPNVVLIM